MPHILVAGKLHPSGRKLLTSAPGMTVRFIDEISEESYAPLIPDADALLIRTQPLSAATVARAGRLRVVSRHGVGYDAVDVEALNNRGIALAVCGDVNSTTVAEHAMMLMLAASKQVLRADEAVRSGPWEWRNRLEVRELSGRNLLLLGYGRIGRRIAAMAAAFGMSIRAYDPYLKARGWPEGAVPPQDDLLAGLGWADIVSVNVPKADEPLIGGAELAAMKDGAILINTARGGIVDETALADALASGKLGAAGLDVFETEPLPHDHPLTRFDNLILSPHIAGVSDGSAERMAIGSAQNILDFFAGHIDPQLVVNSAHVTSFETHT